jgi:hypothetical protein
MKNGLGGDALASGLRSWAIKQMEELQEVLRNAENYVLIDVG